LSQVCDSLSQVSALFVHFRPIGVRQVERRFELNAAIKIQKRLIVCLQLSVTSAAVVQSNGRVRVEGESARVRCDGFRPTTKFAKTVAAALVPKRGAGMERCAAQSGLKMLERNGIVHFAEFVRGIERGGFGVTFCSGK
jgi:hypothetical protein